MQVEYQIERIIEPAVADLGFLIVRVQLSGAYNQRLQIMIEPITGDEMTVDDCAMISRTVSALLDVDDPIKGSYTLEVSSPGIDRPLVRLEDFQRFVDYEARVETIEAIDGRKRFRGRLKTVKDETIVIFVGDRDWFIPYASVRRAKLVDVDQHLAGQKIVNNLTETVSGLA